MSRSPRRMRRAARRAAAACCSSRASNSATRQARPSPLQSARASRTHQRRWPRHVGSMKPICSSDVGFMLRWSGLGRRNRWVVTHFDARAAPRKGSRFFVQPSRAATSHHTVPRQL
jgi:hypothetical protein